MNQEELIGAKAIHNVILSSPELLIQLAGARNVSVLDAYKSVLETIAALDQALAKYERKTS